MKMNRFLSLFIVIIIAISSNLYSQKIGSIFIGANKYLTTEENNEYNVNSTGLSIGCLIPINIPKLKIYYKVKASHYNINKYFSTYYRRELKYLFSAENEIMIGKNIKIEDNINITPQIGFGAIGESVYYDWNKGFTHGGLFIDLSLISTYNFKSIDLGIMINYEKNIIPSSSSMVSEKRLNLSLLISK